MKITGTFLDEISHDIPHQNWGRAEWETDFRHMRAIGIDTVVLIRCGYRKWLTYPSRVLRDRESAFTPPVDLVRMFLELAGRYGMRFFFGLYDSGQYWTNGEFEKEANLNKRVIDEVWAEYGDSPAFGGWYLSQECSRKIGKITELYAELGRHCKAVSNGLPVLISPYIDGPKNLPQSSAATRRDEGISIVDHEKDWDEIFSGIKGGVDIVAFQDGHVEFAVLSDFLSVNKVLCDTHGLTCWTNTETFDRDMPIKFPPIKWEKLLFKLDAAAHAGIHNAITFEFSHFMSPQSAYLQAGHLYNRYREYLAESTPGREGTAAAPR